MPVSGNPGLDLPRHRLEIAWRAGDLFDCRDNKIGSDPIRLVAEIADPQQLRARNIALQADLVDFFVNDRVPVA